MSTSAETEGWRDIAAMVGKALGCSVSESTARRYAAPDWPTAEEPCPLPVGQRLNGVRFLRAADLAAWVPKFKGAAGQRARRDVGRRRGGDLRRAA